MNTNVLLYLVTQQSKEIKKNPDRQTDNHKMKHYLHFPQILVVQNGG